MAYVPESDLTWPAGVFQVETDTPVLGGTPNEATLAGASNIAAMQLAGRTAFLKRMIGGIGSTAGTVTNLDALSATGIFEATSAAVGHPDPGATARALHIEGGSDASQMVLTSAGKTWTRGRVGSTWGDWELHWSDDGSDKLLAQTGYRKSPDGMIEQWGISGGGFVDGFAPISFPIAFPTACWQVSLCDGSGGGTLGNAHHLTYYNVTTTGFTAMCVKPDGSDWSASQFTWRALGI